MNRRTISGILIVWAGLSLSSLIVSRHVLQVDYEADEYGFPQGWVVYYIQGLGSPTGQWIVLPPQTIVVLVFWLAIALVIVLSIQRVSKVTFHSRGDGPGRPILRDAINISWACDIEN
jgi:hypothetical protein